MTKVYINGRFLTQRTTGVQRVAIEVIKSLDQLIDEGRIDPKMQFTIISPKSLKYELHLKNIALKKVGTFSGHIWEQLELPIYTLNSLLINLCGPAPIIKSKQVVTIHDAAVFANCSNYSNLFTKWYQTMFRILKYSSKKVITVSEFSRDELIKFIKLNNKKISAYHLGVDHIKEIKSDLSILERENLYGKNYILAVSSKSPNKNFSSIIKGIQLIKNNNFKCVIVGANDITIFNNVKEEDNHSDHRVKYVGYVTDQELKALYENAACFVFPSIYEGFGLPPIEAMACGCPVIVSNQASMPEICGTNALYCNPFDINDISLKIEEILNDQQLREKMSDSGLQHSRNFEWRKTAVGLYSEIEKIIKTSSVNVIEDVVKVENSTNS